MPCRDHKKGHRDVRWPFLRSPGGTISDEGHAPQTPQPSGLFAACRMQSLGLLIITLFDRSELGVVFYCIAP